MVDKDIKLKQEEEEEEEDESESQLAAGQLTINNMSTTNQALKPVRQPGKPKHLSVHLTQVKFMTASLQLKSSISSI